MLGARRVRPVHAVRGLHRCSAASVGTKHSSGTIYVAFRDPGQILKIPKILGQLEPMLSTGEEGVAALCRSSGLSRCGFRGGRYLEVKIHCKNALGPRIVSAVRSLEVVASRRLLMYC